MIFKSTLKEAVSCNTFSSSISGYTDLDATMYTHIIARVPLFEYVRIGIMYMRLYACGCDRICMGGFKQR